MSVDAALARYARYLETLTPASLDDLGQFVHPRVRFADPFHDLQGMENMRAVFVAMFAAIPDVRFEVLASAAEGQGAFLHWRFTGRFARAPSRRLDFEGTSVIRFDERGLVTAHLDYWDSSAGLLQHFPVMGPLLRWLRRRVAAAVRPASGTRG